MDAGAYVQTDKQPVWNRPKPNTIKRSLNFFFLLSWMSLELALGVCLCTFCGGGESFAGWAGLELVGYL